LEGGAGTSTRSSGLKRATVSDGQSLKLADRDIIPMNSGVPWVVPETTILPSD
jgi:hypothetical protein